MNRKIGFAFVATSMAVSHGNATEVGLLIDKQFGQSFAIPRNNSTIKSFDPIGFGVRGAFTILDLKAMEFGIAATYHPKTKANTTWKSGDQIFTDELKSASEYLSVGAQVNWKFLINVHLGLELRREKISSEFSLRASGTSIPGPLPVVTVMDTVPGTTILNRPWIKGGIGYSIPLPMGKPFVRLEAAYTLKTYSIPETFVNSDDLRKAMAPNYQIALYGGFHF